MISYLISTSKFQFSKNLSLQTLRAYIPAHASLLHGACGVLLVVVVGPVDGQPAAPLLRASHSGEQEDVEDDQRHAGNKVDTHNSEPGGGSRT